MYCIYSENTDQNKKEKERDEKNHIRYSLNSKFGEHQVEIIHNNIEVYQNDVIIIIQKKWDHHFRYKKTRKQITTEKEQSSNDIILDHVANTLIYFREISEAVPFLLHKDTKEHKINTRDTNFHLLLCRNPYPNGKKNISYDDDPRKKEKGNMLDPSKYFTQWSSISFNVFVSSIFRSFFFQLIWKI